MRRLLLVRHGLPDYSARQADDEPPGSPLSNIGADQILQAVPLLRALAPAALHSSPLARARQSAQLVAEALSLPVRIDSDVKEWHRTECLYQVSERAACWLRRWLEGDEPCAAVFSHASPLLSILRTALYLPQHGWWRGRNPELLTVDTCDRFEVSMGSVFEIVFEPDAVTARCRHHPWPRILHHSRRGLVRNLTRPTIVVENREVRRPNFGRLIGYRVRGPRGTGRHSATVVNG